MDRPKTQISPLKRIREVGGLGNRPDPSRETANRPKVVNFTYELGSWSPCELGQRLGNPVH
jgi:hypothetical protein